MAEKLKITLVKSPIGAVPKHKATVEALGLKKLNKTVEMPDNSAVMFWGSCPKRAKERNFNIPLFLYAKIKRKRGAGFPAPLRYRSHDTKMFRPKRIYV